MLNALRSETKQITALRLLQLGDCGVKEIPAIVGCSIRTAFRAQRELRSTERVERIDRLEARIRTLEAEVRDLAEGSHS